MSSIDRRVNVLALGNSGTARTQIGSAAGTELLASAAIEHASTNSGLGQAQ